MGEAKRRRESPFNPRIRTPSVAAAWESYQRLLGPPSERETLAFWAGASVLFYALLTALDEGDEPTDADLALMDRIHAELDAFCQTFDERALAARPMRSSEGHA